MISHIHMKIGMGLSIFKWINRATNIQFLLGTMRIYFYSKLWSSIKIEKMTNMLIYIFNEIAIFASFWGNPCLFEVNNIWALKRSFKSASKQN